MFVLIVSKLVCFTYLLDLRNVLIGMKYHDYLGTKYHGHPSINESPNKNRWMNKSSFEILTRGDVKQFIGSTQGTFIIANHERHLFRIPQKNAKLLCVYGAISLRQPPVACEMSWDVRGVIFHRKKQLMEMHGNEECDLGPPKCYLDVPLEVRINGLFHLLINGVYWGYNPLILTIYKLPGTSKYDWLVLTTLTTKCCSTLCSDHLGLENAVIQAAPMKAYH